MKKHTHSFSEDLHDNSTWDRVIGWIGCVGLFICLLLNSAGYLGVN